MDFEIRLLLQKSGKSENLKIEKYWSRQIDFVLIKFRVIELI